MDHTAVTVFICTSCRGKDNDAERPGRLLFDAITANLRDHLDCGITVTPVECLSVCKRPCTLALASSGKWTYVIGDLNHSEHVEDVIVTALRYRVTEDGIIPWRERPQAVRKGVVSRIPPLSFRPIGM